MLFGLVVLAVVIVGIGQLQLRQHGLLTEGMLFQKRGEGFGGSLVMPHLIGCHAFLQPGFRRYALQDFLFLADRYIAGSSDLWLFRL